MNLYSDLSSGVRGSKLPFLAVATLILCSALAQAPDTVRVTASLANVRAEARASAPVLTTVKGGTKLELRGVEGNWFKVALFLGAVRVEGYVSKSVATLDKGAGGGGASPALPPPAPARSGSAAAASIARSGMSVAVTVGANSNALTPVLARVAKTAARVDSARAAALAMPVGQGSPLPANPGAQITYVWVVDQVAGARVVSDPKPVFVVRYRDAPGVSPEDFSPAIVRLIGTAAGPRVMSAVRGRVDLPARKQADWDISRDLKQEVVRSTVDVTERGVATITPAAPLESGDYAIVMRPTGNKKFAGASAFSEDEEGRVFGIAWVFAVK